MTKENNNYYTPSIEEFHVGFEYDQTMVDNFWNIISWEKLIFNENNNFELIKKFKNLYRVKYLDQSDIESLGWKKSPKYSFYEYKEHQLFFSNIKNPVIAIYPGFGDFSFKGIIKNKSELKKLMSMLNID